MRFSPGLQGLRGVAIVLVLAEHSFPFPEVNTGWVGVDLFFVLSGFLITSILVAEWDRTSRLDFKEFYLRRVRRLLPALVPALAVAVVVMSATQAHALVAAAAAAGYVLNVVLTQGHIGAPIITPMWSLSQEEQFYLLWPAVLLLGLKWRGRSGALLLAGLLALACFIEGRGLIARGATPWRVYFGPDVHALPLMLGCCAALAQIRIPMPRLIAWASISALGMIVIEALLGDALWTDWLTYRGVVVLGLAMVGAVLCADRLGFLSSRLLQRLGLYSYSLYLWHQVVIPTIGMHEMLPISLTLSLGLAVASFHLVEQPVRRAAGRRIPLRAREMLQPAHSGVR
jgi:peptidoglycan/LPS O-acetylase OafA/YrhL